VNVHDSSPDEGVQRSGLSVASIVAGVWNKKKAGIFMPAQESDHFAY